MTRLLKTTCLQEGLEAEHSVQQQLRLQLVDAHVAQGRATQTESHHGCWLRTWGLPPLHGLCAGWHGRAQGLPALSQD